MKPTNHDRAQELFAEAIELAGDELAAFAQQVRQTESPATAEYFDQLLVDHAAAEAAGFLCSPAVPEPSQTSEAATIRQEQLADFNTIDFVGDAPRPGGRETNNTPGPLLADDYEILDEIGKGGMGTVYRAYQLSLRRHVAVKIIPTHLIRSPEEAARFYVEAEAAGRLDHPSIVPVQDVGERNGVHYYTMALVTGGSLADYVGNEKRLTRRRAAEIIEAVSRAVHYAHDRAVIHRDIKPANILLDSQGNPRLTDFGLAKFTNSDDHLTMTGQVMGTPSYMAPEQAEGDTQAMSTRTDVYSLGATLYALLAGKPPFSGETLFSTLQQVQNSLPAPLPPSVPLDLRTICDKCLQKSPQARYASAGDLADDLRRYLDGFPISARRVGKLQRLVGWSRRNPGEAVLVGIVAATLVLATIVSTWFGIQAQRNLAQAEANAREVESTVENTFLYASDELLADAPGMQEVRRRLLEIARGHYEKLLETGHLPADKYASVAYRLGTANSLLGDTDATRELYDRVIEIYGGVLEDSPANSHDSTYWQDVMQLAQVHRDYAALGHSLWRQGKESANAELEKQGLDMFVQHAQRTIDYRRQAADANPDDFEIQRKYANALMNLGIVKAEVLRSATGPERWQEAEQVLEAAQEIRLRIADTHAEPRRVQIDLAKGYDSLGELRILQASSAADQEARLGHLQQALEFQLECAKVLEALPAGAQDRSTDRLLAITWRKCGATYLELSKVADAIKALQKNHAVLSQLLLRDPGIISHRLDLGQTLYDLFQLHMATRNQPLAFTYFNVCQRTLAEGAIVVPDDSAPIDQLVNFTTTVADNLRQGAMPQKGIEQIDYALESLKKLPQATQQKPHMKAAIERLARARQELAAEVQDQDKRI